MPRPDTRGPGPLPAILGGVVAALVIVWLVGIVIGTFVFVVRLVVLVAMAVGGLWAWDKLTRR